MNNYLNGTMPKKATKNEEATRAITSSNFFIDDRYSMVKISGVSAKSANEEKAYALNYFLNKNYFDVINQGINNRIGEISKKRDHMYKYKPQFHGELVSNESTIYSNKHSILAMLVIDLPSSSNENEVITSLKRNYQEIKEFLEDKNSEKTLVVESNAQKKIRFYRMMLRHLIVSTSDLSKYVDIKSDFVKQDKRDNRYIIEKR